MAPRPVPQDQQPAVYGACHRGDGRLRPLRTPGIPVAHYGEQNGDAIRGPEMCFELGFAGGAHLNPFYWRNDRLGIEQWSRFIRDSNYCFHPQLHEQHESFAKLWDKNLAVQRFVEAFTDKCILG